MVGSPGKEGTGRQKNILALSDTSATGARAQRIMTTITKAPYNGKTNISQHQRTASKKISIGGDNLYKLLSYKPRT